MGHDAVNGADYPTKLPNIGRLRHPRYPPRPEGRGLPRNLIKVLETELWDSANSLRTNSKLTAAEYKDPLFQTYPNLPIAH